MISQSSLGDGFFSTSNDGHTLTLHEGLANALAEAGGGTDAVDRFLEGFMGNVTAIVEGVASAQGFNLASTQGRQDFMNYYNDHKEVLDNLLRHMVGGN